MAGTDEGATVGESVCQFGDEEGEETRAEEIDEDYMELISQFRLG